MDIGRPLIEYPRLNIDGLRDALRLQGSSFWAQDQHNRALLAGERPGAAVYYYNEQPNFALRVASNELGKDGRLSVLRNTAYALFDQVDAIVREHVLPRYDACDVIRVQLAELPAGQRITAHRDIGLLTMAHRLHLPIETNEDVVFKIDGEKFFLEPCVLYELNNVVRHSVRNNGASSRIHLLIDLIPHAVGRAIYYDDKKAMALACLT